MRPVFVLAACLIALAGSAGAVPSSAGGAIAAAQRELRRYGYDAGPANGVMSEKTAQALRVYGRAAGTAPSPVLQKADMAVAAAQRSLVRLGYLRGPADGVVGPQTRDAIIRFEVKQRLRVDPRVSDRLLAALDQAGAPSAAAAPAGS